MGVTRCVSRVSIDSYLPTLGHGIVDKRDQGGLVVSQHDAVLVTETPDEINYVFATVGVLDRLVWEDHCESATTVLIDGCEDNIPLVGGRLV